MFNPQLEKLGSAIQSLHSNDSRRDQKKGKRVSISADEV